MARDGVWDEAVQFADMEGGVDPELRWDLEAICILVDFMFDLEGAVPFVIEFLGWACCLDVPAIEPHFVTNLVFQHLLLVDIIVPGHVVGCLGEGCLHLIHDLLHPHHELACCLDLDILDKVGTSLGVETVLHHEWCLVGRQVHAVVVGEFRNWEPVDPVILTLIDEHLKESLKVLVDSLDLAIRLGVVSHANNVS